MSQNKTFTVEKMEDLLNEEKPNQKEKLQTGSSQLQRQYGVGGHQIPPRHPRPRMCDREDCVLK